VLQEGFSKLARRPHLGSQIQDARAFLLKLAHNVVIDRSRRRSARQRNYDQLAQETLSLFAPTEDPDVGVFRQSLTQALQELPIDQRLVVHLKLWEGLTFEAIAEMLNVPANTAASRYRYGLDKLRDRLRPLYEEIH
jgi:RNA polymerase sigma-70 factor (ECF subfamily)